MNILVTCQKPPGFDHPELYRLNINKYKRNKTRKNYTYNINYKGDKLYYIDTYYKDIPNTTPNWFSKWETIPDKSMDYIWGHNCPIFGPLGLEDFDIRLSLFTTSEEAHFVDEYDKLLVDVLTHGRRILKKGGKIVFPLPQTWDGWISDSNQILLIARIMNMEIIPDFLYRVYVIDALSDKHRQKMNNIFILNSYNFRRTKNGNNRILSLNEAFKFLVFEVL